MCSESIDPAATPVQSDSCAPFLAEAQNNLGLVRGLFGRQSTRYQRLVAHYRAAADELGCRFMMERVLASLSPPSEMNVLR
jgi:hypothetical protein